MVDLQWDPRSDHYLLVAYKDGAARCRPPLHCCSQNIAGSIKLWDAESDTDLMTYEKQAGGERPRHFPALLTLRAGVSAVRWIPSQPGGFLTTDSKTGLIRLWNVSNRCRRRVIG